MPGRLLFRKRALAIAATALMSSTGAWAERADAQAPAASTLDAQLFYQLLVGELEMRSGEPGPAYGIMLDAARRTKDERVYRRAAQIALQARAGEQALAATTAWHTDIPDSAEPLRYMIQLLVALNRALDVIGPVQSLVKLTPDAERPALIMSLPQFFARANDHKQAATVLSQALQPYAQVPNIRGAVSAAVGRAWMTAEDNPQALRIAQRALADDPASEEAALLALELLPSMPAAEQLVLDHLKAKPTSNSIRMVYARTLAASQRYGDAEVQLQAVAANQPKLASAWLTLGALNLELRQPKQANTALLHYVDLVQSGAADAGDKKAAADPHPGPEEDDGSAAPERGLTQAWLMLAQAAEQQGDFKAADAWLDRIDSPQRALEVQSRRASLLAKQGKLSEARELIRKAPEKDEDDARAKVLAEVQILRDTKHWADANTLLANANRKYPNDVDLLYEQSMVAEKLDRLDEMERLLRKVIELKPDHQHAYNALGYSLAERNLRLPEAKALIERALQLAPGEPFITDSMGWVEYRIGNREEALKLLRRAYHSRPDPEIAAHLGEVLWVSGQRDEARKVWREGRSRDSSNDVLRETLARLRVDGL